MSRVWDYMIDGDGEGDQKFNFFVDVIKVRSITNLCGFLFLNDFSRHIKKYIKKHKRPWERGWSITTFSKINFGVKFSVPIITLLISNECNYHDATPHKKVDCSWE